MIPPQPTLDISSLDDFLVLQQDLVPDMDTNSVFLSTDVLCAFVREEAWEKVAEEVAPCDCAPVPESQVPICNTKTTFHQ